MLTRLEWCREMAPSSCSYLSDSELLNLMESALRRAEADGTVFDDSGTYTSKLGGGTLYKGMQQIELLDYMFTVLSKQLNDKIAYKGNYILNSLFPDSARLTRDIDLDIFRNEDQETVVVVLQAIGDELLAAGVIDHIEMKGCINGLRSGGCSYIIGGEGKNKVKVGVDIGWVPDNQQVIKRVIKGIEVNGFDIHCHMADKIATQVRNERTRRTKDLF